MISSAGGRLRQSYGAPGSARPYNGLSTSLTQGDPRGESSEFLLSAPWPFNRSSKALDHTLRFSDRTPSSRRRFSVCIALSRIIERIPFVRSALTSAVRNNCPSSAWARMCGFAIKAGSILLPTTRPARRTRKLLRRQCARTLVIDHLQTRS